MNSSEFGEYLRGLRKKRGLTLTELSNKSKVSQPHLSHIENGKRGIPSPEILYKLSGPLGVSYAELMDKAGYLPDDDIKKSLTLMLEETLSLLTINNKFFDFLMNDVRKVEEKYKDCMEEEGEEITPDWLRQQVKNSSWDEEWVHDIVKEFVIIAKKHNLDYEEIARKRQIEEQAAKELVDILHLNGITYRGQPLDPDDRKRILIMLEQLFPERKG